jgi:glutamate synthase domain-containing protein 1/glutamate synthase domain-containing protein 3
MRNRGNGKGGGAALAGLNPIDFGVSQTVLDQDYALAIAYLDRGMRNEVEGKYINAHFNIDHQYEFKTKSMDPAPPDVVVYFVQPTDDALDAFSSENGLDGIPRSAIEDELVYRNSFRLNNELYSSLGEKKAFVLSHGKDMLALKLVGYGHDVIRAYGLEDFRAHVWIGHHRYPTKGRVWHPGGAHPFVGLHEALVHNGDFANYISMCSYLAQRNIRPLFLTDTEVSVLVFDLLHRTYGYPLEYVIEALAPTTERDFHLLSEEKQRIYRMIQTVHMHGSPDGPWFFLIAQSTKSNDPHRDARLIGITDTSMLRPQVFALQEGGEGRPSVGFAASEKQAIDAALESLAAEDSRYWGRADHVWNARGGSHSDGGAFIFSVRRPEGSPPELQCHDKFGNQIMLDRPAPLPKKGNTTKSQAVGNGSDVPDQVIEKLQGWSYAQVNQFLSSLSSELVDDEAREKAILMVTTLIDRRFPTGQLRRSYLRSLLDQTISNIFEAIRSEPSERYQFHSRSDSSLPKSEPNRRIILDAREFEAQGKDGLSRAIVRLAAGGHRQMIVAYAKGHRFIGNGLGANSQSVKIEVYGSSGDYLASGIDGAEIVVHGSGQDQLAQIMKTGKLVVHGDVGQTFMYAAKGGEGYVLGNAAGRPLINAVGSPKVVINGTCLDYLAESFMAGDPLEGGGFVILNGVRCSQDGILEELDTPYPGGNLFSLASGGAIFLRDPHNRVGEDQLNGGRFLPMEERYWELMLPILEENDRLFGISVDMLLTVEQELRSPEEVYRIILPGRLKALQAEEAWVVH